MRRLGQGRRRRRRRRRRRKRSDLFQGFGEDGEDVDDDQEILYDREGNVLRTRSIRDFFGKHDNDDDAAAADL